jgi:ferredoxin-type protein NapF
MGRWIALATLAGACLGYPLVLWLDPLALFSGSFGLRSSAAGSAGWLALAGLAGILVSNVFWPRAWCRRICPLGATQELLVLPLQILKPSFQRRQPITSRSSPTKAEGSQHAPPLTPGATIADGPMTNRAYVGTRGLPRRSLLSLGADAVATAVGFRLAIIPWSQPEQARRAIRPPGAAGRGQFSWLCVRCGNCVRSCPEQIIHPDDRPGELIGLLAPVIRFDTRYCRETCRRCTEVCPSGAIRPLSLDQKRRTPIGLARVDMTWCLLAPENGERECGICQRACPYGAIEFEFDYATYVSTPRVAAALCTGCGACEVACPGTNEPLREQSGGLFRLRKAIFVVP